MPEIKTNPSEINLETNLELSRSLSQARLGSRSHQLGRVTQGILHKNQIKILPDPFGTHYTKHT